MSEQFDINIGNYEVTESVYDFIVQETHLDFLGHMNNATYLEIYEQARWEMITNNNWGVRRIMKEKRGPVIIEINIKYKAELTLRQPIKIHTKIIEIKNPKVLTIQQEMRDHDGKVYNTITMDVGLFDLKARKLIAANSEWLDAIGLKKKSL